MTIKLSGYAGIRKTTLLNFSYLILDETHLNSICALPTALQ